KSSGKRAYVRARRGEEVALAPRLVRVDCIEILGYEFPDLRLCIECGKGTYIRSIARDLGETLGCGAYVTVLRRTRIGPFTPEQPVPLDADVETARGRLLPIAAAVAHLPRVVLGQAEARRLRTGQSVVVPKGSVLPEGEVAVFDRDDQLVGIG